MSEGVVASELSFTHPLYRAAIYADLSPTRRQMLHARAAECCCGAGAPCAPDCGVRGCRRVARGRTRGASLSRASALGELGTSAWAFEQAAFLSPDVGGSGATAARCRGSPARLPRTTPAAARVLAPAKASSARRARA